jgi:hypothetical protein
MKGVQIKVISLTYNSVVMLHMLKHYMSIMDIIWDQLLYTLDFLEMCMRFISEVLYV